MNENKNHEFKETRIEMQVKNVVDSLKEKYSSLVNKQISQLELEMVNRTLAISESYRQLQVAEFISNKLPSDSLVFLAQPCSEMKQEFFNRIRLNTIKKKQVFFPIAFSEFVPNIAYKQEPYPLEVEINKHKGYFNMDYLRVCLLLHLGLFGNQGQVHQRPQLVVKETTLHGRSQAHPYQLDRSLV